MENELSKSMPCSPSDQPCCSPPSLLTVLSQGPPRWKLERPLAAATKSPWKYHSHPEGPKELQPPAARHMGKAHRPNSTDWAGAGDRGAR